MRKFVLITAAVSALVGAGMAVAHQFDSKSVSAVSATFIATTPSLVKTSTCTGPNGTYTNTRATYTGSATSTSPSLNGALSISVDSVINTTTNIGTVSGRIRIGSGNDNDAHFDAVYSNGNLAGLVVGRLQDPNGQLLGNISAPFSTAGGFAAGGKIGGGTGGGDAVLVSRGGCKPAPAPKPEVINVHGNVTSISLTSITAAGVTCVIPTDLQAAVADLKLSNTSWVEMTCTASGGTNTLTRLSTPGHHDVHSKSKGDHDD